MAFIGFELGLIIHTPPECASRVSPRFILEFNSTIRMDRALGIGLHPIAPGRGTPIFALVSSKDGSRILPARVGGETESQRKFMKQKLIVTFLSVAAFVVGCKPAAEQSPTPISVQNAAEKVEAKTKDAAQATKELTQAKKEYAFAQKAEFVAEKQTQLAEINRELDALTVKVEASSAATKADAQPKLQALRDQSGKLNKQLDEAKGATETTWDKVKSGSNKAYDELKDGFQHARQWVSEKISP